MNVKMLATLLALNMPAWAEPSMTATEASAERAAEYDLKLEGGAIFYLYEPVFPSGLASLGYRISPGVGLYLTTTLTGILLEPHFYLFDGDRFAASINLGIGFNPIKLIDDAEGLAGRIGAEFDIKLSERFYIPVEFYMSLNKCADNDAPVDERSSILPLFHLTTGLGFTF